MRLNQVDEMVRYGRHGFGVGLGGTYIHVPEDLG
jgi:hypothetical protein